MHSDNIKRFLKRYEKAVYIVILAIGVILIGSACILYPKPTQESYIDSRTYDILLSLGCSIVATEIIALILVAMIPKMEDEVNNGWAPIQVYQERNSIKIVDREFPKDHLDFIAFGLRHFLTSNKENQLIEKVRKGVHIRIITMDPSSIFLSEYSRFEGNNDIRDEILDLTRIVSNVNRKVKKGKGSIDIKYYDTLPFLHYCRADNRIYVGPYLPGKDSGQAITSQYDILSDPGNMYSGIFDSLWTGQSNIKLRTEMLKEFKLEIGNAVGRILKLYCQKLGGETGKPVIGIIVLFKGEKRRTLYSHGKTEPEKHNCHNKNDGVVGLMCKNSKSLLLNDYENQIAFTFSRSRRTEILRIEYTTDRLDPKEDTKAILAVPIWRGMLIGALTFDFAEIPAEYGINAEHYKSQEMGMPISAPALEKLFETAEECRNLVENMIGNSFDDEVKRFYEEEWV